MPKGSGLTDVRKAGGGQEFLEGPRTVTHSMLPYRIHFAERLAQSFRDEDGIITETFAPAGRKLEVPADFALEGVGLPAVRDKRQHANEFRREIRCAFFPQFILNSGDANGKILVRPSPPRGVNSGGASKRCHAQPGIVRERRKAAATRR